MAFKSTVELYSSIILPRLAESPKTVEQLDVPQYAVKQLNAHGLIKALWVKVQAAKRAGMVLA